MKKYQCFFCGYIYDEAAGEPDEGIAPARHGQTFPRTGIARPVAPPSPTSQ